VSRSSKLAAPGIPKTVQVVIKAGRVSITKHLRYEKGQYVGRAYDYRKKTQVEIAFPLSILTDGLKGEVGPKLAERLAA
jgi:hypothetical protein